MSHPIIRRRFSRAVALVLAGVCAALAAPAVALADGQLDPSFNGSGFHVGSAAEQTIFSNTENRIPMVVQADGKIVAGGSRGGFMTLVRYTTNGSIDATFGNGGFATRQFGGTPSQTSGTSGAVAMTQDASGNILVAGFGGSQSMVVARFTAAGAYNASAVCYAPHLIDYTARALAVRPNGSIVLAGYGRDRHASAAVPPTGPAVLYGLRAVVTLPGSGNSTTACGTYSSAGGFSLGSSGVTVDGVNHDGTGADPAQAGRFYDAVVALPDNRYVVASTSGPGGTAWVARYTAAGALDGTFAGGRVTLAATSLHALALLGDGSLLAAGESVDAAVSANRQMQVTRIAANGTLAAYGTGGVARSRVAGGSNTGQAIAVQGDGSVIVAGSANLAGKTAFALTRFNPAGVRDDLFGSHGETTTPFGTPAINGYITGIGLTGNLLAVAGRLTDAAGLVVTAARYYATGAPPPPPPPPAASTLGVDQITSTAARVTGTLNANGTASNWWLEYGTSTAYGTKSAVQPLAGTTNDVDVGVNLSGLSPGTVYHARLVISNGIGTTPGDDIAFTTLGGSGGGGQPGGPPGTNGKKFCKVPKVVGKKVNAARKKVFAAGCKAKVVYKKSKRHKGIVLAQSRKANKKLVYRAVVKLTVSTKQTPKKAK